ncbi:signal recognition particle receptor subunit beta, putative [Entamoeba invadens IP1]|uniref:Signal recognition particle receptor subunit beta n=2 Tax=Entamoeba invadens TaxID=33085 RepID=A0A0A1TY16_ENTIV|nr:signal recognition particle receptor subunit beta, putative [Entamoeba invadens IP1]ELP86407.1 signal recognition particle receptor subunit beta, putative [Entamoeba invadens IP1]BAN40739.1 signal recognition particle receptor subunit beta, putative [Entamoeba invadens]|eukprot:XP_004185753.1 signal recognition particle receptor subunit beta, putative [Entamoeba invadens IP1]
MEGGQQVTGSSSGVITMVITSLFVLLVTAVIYFLTKKLKKSSKRTSLMIAGISGVGKTSLFLCLQNDHTTETCTSMVENSGVYKQQVGENKEKLIDIVDIPGYGKVRNLFKKYINETKGILFLVSSVDVKKSVKEDAAYLHDIILNNTQKVPILVLCNKSEVTLSESEEVIKMLLEKELNKLRKRVAKPGEVISDDDLFMYGDPDDEFKFAQLDFSVTFARASVKENDIDNAINFINSFEAK